MPTSPARSQRAPLKRGTAKGTTPRKADKAAEKLTPDVPQQQAPPSRLQGLQPRNMSAPPDMLGAGPPIMRPRPANTTLPGQPPRPPGAGHMSNAKNPKGVGSGTKAKAKKK